MNELQGFLPASAVVETEHIPYLLTEKGTLIFTVAPNGHVWGHRVEDGGTKRDVELEVYAPANGGYTLRRRGEHASSWSHENDLTEGQTKAIRRIFAQKALCSVLGRLVLNEGYENFLKLRYSERNPSSFGERCNVLQARGSNFNNVKLIDCLVRNQVSHQKFLGIDYQDDKFTFQIGSAYYSCAGGASVANVHLRKVGEKDEVVFGKAGPEDLRDLYRRHYRFFENGSKSEFPHYVVFAAQAKNKKFFVGHFPACVERHLFPNELTVLCDTENVFDVFQIDDALLLLEEKRVSETESELYWTFAVAKNKVVGELRRMQSNNPTIFSV